MSNFSDNLACSDQDYGTNNDPDIAHIRENGKIAVMMSDSAIDDQPASN